MKRISTIASIFPNSDLLIDIGADHGYLGIELLKKKKINTVWNVEISSLALQNCKKNYSELGLLDKARFFLSDGFKNVPKFKKKVPEFNSKVTAVISGIGSIQILEILKNLPKNIENLIICSHTLSYPIRTWALKNLWTIHREEYLEKKKIVYIVIWLKKINLLIKKSLEELIFGEFKFWKSNFPLFKKYWVLGSKKILKIPEEYRNKDEKKILEFLDTISILNV